MKKIFVILIEKLHVRIFGHEMSSTMKAFLGNLSWSFFGYIIGGILSLVVSILAGRILGPTEYGKYNLVLTIGSFLAVIMFFGFDATSVKYISSSKTGEDKKKVISNSVRFTAITSLLVLVLAILFSRKISEYLNTTQVLIFFGALFGLVTMYNYLADDFIKSLQLFKFQSLINILQSAVIFVLFVFLFLIFHMNTHENSYEYYSAIIMFAALIVIMIYFVNIRDKIGGWSKTMWKSMVPYWKLTLSVSFVSVTIGSVDKFFLSHYLGAAQLGIYSAYLLSSTLIVGHIVSALGNVFLPTITSEGNQPVVLKKIDQLTAVGFLPTIIVVSIISFVIMKLFGSQYQLNYWYILIVAFISFLQILTGFYGALIASSVNLFRLSTKIYYFKPIAIGLVILVLVLNPEFISIYTIFTFAITSYLYDIISTRSCFFCVKEY